MIQCIDMGIGRLYTTMYIVCIFMLFVDSMYPWYMWNNLIVRYITVVATFILSVCLILNNPYLFKRIKRHLVCAILLFICLIWIAIHEGGNLLSFLLKYVILISLLFLKTEYKIHALRFITKCFSCLLLFSLITYILFLFGIKCVSPSIYIYGIDQYVRLNYYTFVTSVGDLDYFRFASVFLEPGHLTMGVVPLIIANRFDLKNKYVMFLLIVELFTFSLAGYITLFVGYVLFNISFSRLKYLLIGIFVCGIAIWVLNNNGYSDMLDQFLWDRLEYSDGDIAGNNRTTSSFDAVYESVINSSNKWFGDSLIDVSIYGGISGYKKFIVQNGIVGVFLVFMVYVYYFISYKKYDLIVFTLILLMLLVQNSYPLWNCIIMVYILGVENLRFKNKFQ